MRQKIHAVADNTIFRYAIAFRRAVAENPSMVDPVEPRPLSRVFLLLPLHTVTRRYTRVTRDSTRLKHTGPQAQPRTGG